MRIDRLAFERMRPAPAPEVRPPARLACALIEQALFDLRDASAPLPVRASAAAFIESDSFTVCCQQTSINPEAARGRLLMLVRVVVDEIHAKAHDKRDAGRVDTPTDAPSTSAALTADGLPDPTT